MKEYEVFVREEVLLSVLVEAESEEEALEKWEDSADRAIEIDSWRIGVEVGNYIEEASDGSCDKTARA